jgi:uncharacterized membrane protein
MASANNHEKATGYVHLTFNVAYGVALAELAVCACGCGEVCHATEALWNDDMDLPYVSFQHMAEHQQEVRV